MLIATEIVTMKTVDGIAKEEFIDIVTSLERNFHSKQPGFIDTELLHNEKDGEWIIIQHWNSLEDMKAASKKMFNNPVTEKFVKSLNSNAVKMLMLPQTGTWNNETV